MPEADNQKARIKLPGGSYEGARLAKNSLVPTLSIKNYTPDAERENEFLWGDPRGFAFVQAERLKKMQG